MCKFFFTRFSSKFKSCTFFRKLFTSISNTSSFSVRHSFLSCFNFCCCLCEYSSLPLVLSSLVDVKVFFPDFFALPNCSLKVGAIFSLIFPKKDLTLPGFFTPPPLLYPLGVTCLLYKLFAINFSSLFHEAHFVSNFSG